MGTKVSLPYVPDSTRDSLFQNVDASLASFFERPIMARTYTWTPGQGSPFTAIFVPWNDFFGNSRVINRINNYNLMRANLHVRFLINGNGFYYGRLMADYFPLNVYDDVTSGATLIPDNAVQASQRMKVFIDPSTCCSQEMELPFVYTKDGVSIVSGEWSQLGGVYVRELQGLKHANASVQPLTITVMLWATDVQYAIPTSASSSALIAQAGDEYDSSGPVEATASAVAAMAGAVSSVPGIGGFALATQMAAKSVSKAASIMGWSRPCEIEPARDMRPKYVSDLAPAGAGDNVAKLSVDSKQEVTVDPNVVGIDLPDEMGIAAIAARESWLTSVPWTTGRIAGDLLWTARVSPHICRLSSSVYYLPACQFAAWPFQWWRCKMRYRLQIVASDYHKGRLRVVWDPSYVQSVEANVQFTKIIDISEERDVTVEVDWGQTQHFLQTPANLTAGSNIWRNTPAFSTASAGYNGVFSVYVLNDLATPNSTVNNDIAFNVYVSAVDLEVAVPTSIGAYTNQYAATVQAGEEMAVMDSSNDPGCGPAQSQYQMGEDTSDANDALVYFGERVVSFRQLLKRYNEHSSFVIANTSATVPAVWAPIFTDVPFYYGYNNAALHSPTVAGKFSYVSNTLLQWLMPAYACMRGAQRSKYVVTTTTPGAVGNLTVLRTPGIAFSLPTAPTVLSITSQSAYARLANPNRRDCLAGAATTSAANQPFLEVEFPFYKPLRFDESKSVQQTAPILQSPFFNTHMVEVTLAPGTTPVVLTRYTGVGEDFGLYWFQGCPPLVLLAPPA